MQFIENRTFDELKIGDSADLTRTLSDADVMQFAAMSGDLNPAHIDRDLAGSQGFEQVIAHGMWGGVLVAAVVATELPGPGSVYRAQNLRYRQPVLPGDTVTVRVAVRDKDAGTGEVVLACDGRNLAGETVFDGEVIVAAPTLKIRRPRVLPTGADLHAHAARFGELLDATGPLAPIRTAVVHPCDPASLAGALEAAARGLIAPVLVGPKARIAATAAAIGRDLGGTEIVDAPHSHAAAERAVALARAGSVAALMKGALHTDEIMAAVVDRALGLRTERRMSHIFVLDAPTYPKPLFITDAAINIAPDLDDKRDIVRNAIDLAHALSIAAPKVAILSSVETVYSKVASTIDAAALCKMADRGQITGGILDGPLAFDNAISKRAAEAKGIVSAVAGDADILIVPDLEAGNMLAKQLVYLAGAEAAGIVLGASVPIVLTSRADGTLARLASCALAQIFVHHRSIDGPRPKPSS